MTTGWQHRLQEHEVLREVVQQATASLIAMDAERLEELAQCCADLNREMQETAQQARPHGEDRKLLTNAVYEMQLFERILFETRANLTVFSRLHGMRLREAGLLTQEMTPYGAAEAGRRDGSGKPGGDARYGDN